MKSEMLETCKGKCHGCLRIEKIATHLGFEISDSEMGIFDGYLKEKNI